MWELFGRVLNRFFPATAKVAAVPSRNAPTGDFWNSTTGPALAQGDFLRDCLVPVFGSDVRPGGLPEAEVVVCQANLIVVTQSCDLENKKAQFVALCPIYTLDEFAKINSKFANKHERDEVRKGRHEGLHMLASPINPANNLEALIVDFRQIYSLPFSTLTNHAASQGDRWRLQSPFLEHFSQAFARFFMRVGLPSTIPQFK